MNSSIRISDFADSLTRRCERGRIRTDRELCEAIAKHVDSAPLTEEEQETVLATVDRQRETGERGTYRDVLYSGERRPLRLEEEN